MKALNVCFICHICGWGFITFRIKITGSDILGTVYPNLHPKRLCNTITMSHYFHFLTHCSHLWSSVQCDSFVNETLVKLQFQQLGWFTSLLILTVLVHSVRTSLQRCSLLLAPWLKQTRVPTEYAHIERHTHTYTYTESWETKLSSVTPTSSLYLPEAPSGQYSFMWGKNGRLCL